MSKRKTTEKKLSATLNKPIFSLSSEAKVRIPLFDLAFSPLKSLLKNWQTFFLLGVPYAMLLCLTSMLLKRNTLCGIDSHVSLGFELCADSPLSFYADMILRFLIITIFAYKWYDFAFLQKPFNLKNIFGLSGRWLKSAGIMAFFIILNLLPLVALFLMMIRVPNPNWKIEMIFFTSVAWIYLLPILAIRFYSVIAFFLSGEKTPSVRTIWNNTAGNMLKLLLSVSVIVFLALFFFMQYYGAVQRLTDADIWTAIMAEFEYDILVAFFIALSITYCHTQKTLIFTGTDNE